jgi:phosphatidylethanolamine/phosphatidyl-N-methylethanolamine N-methyltransferase
MNKAIVRRIYNNYASFYNILFSGFLNPARKKAIEKMKLEPNQSVIEFGVGTGLSFKYYNKEAELYLTGIDISEKMLAKAEKEVKKNTNLIIKLECIDGENTPYDDSSFDKVVMMYVYSVTPNPEKLLMEAFRICKENGSVYIINHFSNFNGENLNILENWLKNFSNLLGFRSDFSFFEYVTKLDLNIESIDSANLFSLTKIVHLKKIDNLHILSK